jgi:hypothetical protein
VPFTAVTEEMDQGHTTEASLFFRYGAETYEMSCHSLHAMTVDKKKWALHVSLPTRSGSSSCVFHEHGRQKLLTEAGRGLC